MNQFNNMVESFLIPGYIEVYLVSNKNISRRDLFDINHETKEQVHKHPEYNLFKWLELNQEREKISQLIMKLPQPKWGKKNVITIYEDKTVKWFVNAKNSFVPTLAHKNMKPHTD